MTTNSAIVVSNRNKSLNAARRTIDVYGDFIWSMARKSASSEKEAERATTEIFVEIWRRLSQIDSAPASEFVFIYAITRSTLRRLNMEYIEGTQIRGWRSLGAFWSGFQTSSPSRET